MSQKFDQIEVGLDEQLEEKLQWLSPNYSQYRILRQSVDARTRHSPHFVYSVEVFSPNETPPKPNFTLEKINHNKPQNQNIEPVIIIGAGPAGLFAALRLSERGIPCRLIEQGSTTEKRVPAIAKFWRYGDLHPTNNVGFGEGGAGLFSDGKLITRIKSPHIPYVMRRLVECGAPEEIEYLSNPHVGSDRIRRVIPKLREKLIQNGVQIHYETKITELIFENQKFKGVKTAEGETFTSSRAILACGHSAENIFQHLKDIGIQMDGKSFAIGLRIEHPQKLINQIQYREHADHPKLKSAAYKLAEHDHQSGIGVYSFCMCPGGYVLSSGTEEGHLVSNGMSNYNRGSDYANAAIVVSIDHDKNFKDDLFGGMKFRRSLEAEAFQMVTSQGKKRELPAQKLNDFIHNKNTTSEIKSSSPSGVVSASLNELLPKEVKSAIEKSIQAFDKKMKGFASEEAVLHGVETRTSCPVRITRDKDTLQSISHQGLYPCGEGAGYAGGITSAACDGIKIADRIFEELKD